MSLFSWMVKLHEHKMIQLPHKNNVTSKMKSKVEKKGTAPKMYASVHVCESHAYVYWLCCWC